MGAPLIRRLHGVLFEALDLCIHFHIYIYTCVLSPLKGSHIYIYIYIPFKGNLAPRTVLGIPILGISVGSVSFVLELGLEALPRRSWVKATRDHDVTSAAVYILHTHIYIYMHV